MISNQEIRRQVVHDMTYTKGLQYYSKGKVAKLAFDPKTKAFSADVLGQQLYHVVVTFSEQKAVLSATCQCQAYANYKGACKHIVAVLKAVQMNWDRHWVKDYKDLVPDLEEVAKKYQNNELGAFSTGESNIFSKNLEADSEALLLQEEKLRSKVTELATHRFYQSLERFEFDEMQSTGEISLIPVIIVNDDGAHGPSRTLEISLRTQRIFQIKQVREFIAQVHLGQPIAFGKTFTYDPKINQLDYKSQKLWQFLESLYWNEKQLEEGYGSPGNTRFAKGTLVFEGKRVRLNDQSFYELLDILEEDAFDLRFESYLERDLIETYVVHGNPNFEIEVAESGNDLALILKENRRNLRVLDRKGMILYYQGVIYKTDPDYASAMGPLLAQTGELSEVRIQISPERMDHFFAKILPKLEQQAVVKLAAELEEKVVREPMEVEVYLDQWQNEIMADVVFKYGNKEIQPFKEGLEITTGESVKLIRDYQGEMETLEWFAKAQFYRVGNALRLQDVEAIGDFYYSGLEVLLSMATVFRTERFMTTTIKLPNPFKVQCKMEQSAGMLELKVETEGLSREELLALIASHRQKKRYHRLKNGDLVALHEGGAIADLDELSSHLNLKINQLLQESVTLPAYRAVYLEAMSRDKDGLRIERDQAFKQLIRNLEEPEDLDMSLPDPLKSVLRDYQTTGFKWLKVLSKYGFGGILADDMGLGKTLQVLAFLLSEKEEKQSKGLPAGRALIVVPTSLIYNWQAEVEKFSSSLNLRIVSGMKAERVEKLSNLDDVDLVVTTYGLLKRDLDYYRNIAFEYCIIDEAQHIKNANTLSARSVKCIKARNTFALTGTPIENGLTELWSIFDFIMPGYLYQSGQFINRYANPIIKDGDQQVLSHLRRHIQPFVLRRLKQDVLLELPEKIESRMVNQMTPEQSKNYAAWQMRAKKEFEEEIMQNSGQPNKIKILALLTRLRQLACHPALFLEGYTGGSGKLDQLMELVDDAISGGHRLLIFSQFTTLLGIVSKALEAQNIDTWYIDGSVSAEDRINRVKAFNEGDKSVFLISLKAGGTGLNLTGADMVVHLDPWWNPAVEDQATDRAYRIGQTKVVQVFRMITKGTIEEKIDELKAKKRALIEEMITPGDEWLEKVSVTDMMALFED